MRFYLPLPLIHSISTFIRSSCGKQWFLYGKKNLFSGKVSKTQRLMNIVSSDLMELKYHCRVHAHSGPLLLLKLIKKIHAIITSLISMRLISKVTFTDSQNKIKKICNELQLPISSGQLHWEKLIDKFSFVVLYQVRMILFKCAGNDSVLWSLWMLVVDFTRLFQKTARHVLFVPPPGKTAINILCKKSKRDLKYLEHFWH